MGLQESESWRETQVSSAVVVEALKMLKCEDKIGGNYVIERNPLVCFSFSQYANEKQRHKHGNRTLQRKIRNTCITARNPG